MIKGYYVASKPLQYFNITNIADEVSHKTCLIVDVFYKAKEFFDNIKTQLHWGEVLFFATSKDAYRWLSNNLREQDYLYIDSDYGLKKTIWLSKIKSKNIFVYEEGTGSYRNDLITGNNKNAFLITLLKFIGFKEYMGGGRYTKGIILYNVEKHKEQIHDFSKMRKNFKTGFMEHFPFIKEHYDFQMIKYQYLLEDIKSKNVLIYLTSWEYNNKVNSVISDYPDYIKIIKPHPHIKIKYQQTAFNYVLSNDIFVEIFLINAIQLCNEIIVLHENSSAMQYINSNKVQNILL